MLQLFHERLVAERERCGKTQDQIVELTGVSKRSYCAYELGETPPSAKLLTALAGLGWDVNYLLTGCRIAGNVAESSLVYSRMSERDAKLLDNIAHCTEEDRRAIERLALNSAELQKNAEPWDGIERRKRKA